MDIKIFQRHKIYRPVLLVNFRSCVDYCRLVAVAEIAMAHLMATQIALLVFWCLPQVPEAVAITEFQGRLFVACDFGVFERREDGKFHQIMFVNQPHGTTEV